MDGRRDHVVGALAHVDVVVGVYGRLGADLTAQNLDGAVADHLVGVHVGRSAGAGLIDVNREIPIPSTVRHLLRRLDNCLGQLRLQVSQFLVDLRGGQLDQPQRTYEAAREGDAADGEVLHRAHGLCAVECVGWHLYRSQ